MIENISLQNFKLHKDSSLDLSNLTVLTGRNGMGKSSLIQSLLLLRQSFLSNDLKMGLNLKGNLCDMGTSVDLECQSADDDILRIGLDMGGNNCLSFHFKYSNDIYATLLDGVNVDTLNFDSFQDYSLFNTHFQYLSAFRFGPQKSYGRDSAIVQTRKQISKINGQCEYAVHYLFQFGTTDITLRDLALSLEGVPEDYSLKGQVERWLRRLSPMISLNISSVEDEFRLQYKFDRIGNMKTDEISALNTGFGITYALPILVAVLSSSKDALILIENPEAHLHPKGQAVLMDLISLAAKNGVQIVIETHSDHIINGALRNVSRNRLPKDLLSIYHFERDEEKHESSNIKLDVTEDGNVLNPPAYFFDQIENDLSEIMGIG